MAPRDTDDSNDSTAASRDAQYLYVIRHGDRWDYAHPNHDWIEHTTRRGDPPISALGAKQAMETGMLLDSLMTEDGIAAEHITWLSSPFLRTLQTSDAMLNAFQNIKTDQVKIHPEDSIFEMDGHGGKQHESLPPIEERYNYFPRLNVTHESLFTPKLPESRSDFLPRCDRAIKEFNRRYPFKPRSVYVLVTHAAACVGLARAASNLTLQEVNPAGPCSVFKLSRTTNSNVWSMDHFAKPGGFNGHLDHLSDMGVTTYPWNHFADRKVNKGYTGPPDSPHIELCAVRK